MKDLRNRAVLASIAVAIWIAFEVDAGNITYIPGAVLAIALALVALIIQEDEVEKEQ